MPSELSKKFEDLIESIKSSYDYQEYQALYQKMKQNAELQKLIAEIKGLQKKLVKLETNKQDIKGVNQMYQAKLRQLEKYPLYQEFLQKQRNVNETLQIIKREIEQTLENIVDIRP